MANTNSLWLAIDAVTRRPLEVIVQDTDDPAYKVHALLVASSREKLLGELQRIFGKGDDAWLKFRYVAQPTTTKECKRQEPMHIFFNGVVIARDEFNG